MAFPFRKPVKRERSWRLSTSCASCAGLASLSRQGISEFELRNRVTLRIHQAIFPLKVGETCCTSTSPAVGWLWSDWYSSCGAFDEESTWTFGGTVLFEVKFGFSVFSMIFSYWKDTKNYHTLPGSLGIYTSMELAELVSSSGPGDLGRPQG